MGANPAYMAAILSGLRGGLRGLGELPMCFYDPFEHEDEEEQRVRSGGRDLSLWYDDPKNAPVTWRTF